MVSRLPNGRTLSFYQREAPQPHIPTAEEGFMPAQLTHRQLFQIFKGLSDEQRNVRHKVVCIPDTSLANYLQADLNHVRELLSDLAESGKVHRTSVDRKTGAGCWTLGAGW